MSRKLVSLYIFSFINNLYLVLHACVQTFGLNFNRGNKHGLSYYYVFQIISTPFLDTYSLFMNLAHSGANSFNMCLYGKFDTLG
jgi:hypothetical protein